ncbi:MAG TPA: sigma-70 family RNA polymerase sigma factor [Polyangiaceae bacterium]|nr:sigma-70 family RNA polymerase sigma factor [Polyangiaceae bacterium]
MTCTAHAELSDACYVSGLALFPRVAWSGPEFREECLRRWAGQPAKDLENRLAVGRGLAEEYLILACLGLRPGAIETLDDEYIVPLKARVRRICPQPATVDDVLQMVREKVLSPPAPGLSSYENRGYLSAWLTIIAVRTALDVTRRTHLQSGQLVELDEKLMALATSPETEYLCQEVRAAFRKTLREAIQRLPAKHRFALKMQLVGGWSIDQIGRALSTHRATAARWLVSAREQLEQDVRQQLVQHLGLDEREITYLMGHMRSQLDIRFSQMFRTAEHSSVHLEEGRASALLSRR